MSTLSRQTRVRLSVTGPIVGVLLSFALLAPCSSVQSYETSATHAQHTQHAGHAAGGAVAYLKSVRSYEIPDVTLTNMQGTDVSLRSALRTDQPVLLNFIFTTCTTICPVLSATFSHAQEAMSPDGLDPRFVSISIDPEHDTPARLRAYAQKFNAGARWKFMTGDVDTIVAVQKAFDVYRGDKMNHPLVTLLRASADGPWLRLEGFTTGADLAREYRMLLGHGS